MAPLLLPVDKGSHSMLVIASTRIHFQTHTSMIVMKLQSFIQVSVCLLLTISYLLARKSTKSSKKLAPK